MLAVPGILSVEALGKGPWWEAPFKVRLLITHPPYPSQKPLFALVSSR